MTKWQYANNDDNNRVLYEGCSDTNARIADRLQTFLVHQEVANWGEKLLIEIDWILNQIVSCYRKSQTGQCDHQEKMIYQH